MTWINLDRLNNTRRALLVVPESDLYFAKLVEIFKVHEAERAALKVQDFIARECPPLEGCRVFAIGYSISHRIWELGVEHPLLFEVVPGGMLTPIAFESWNRQAKHVPAGGPQYKIGDVVYLRDGNQWCAVWPDFQNLQESPAGFGPTCLEARADLAHTEIDQKLTNKTINVQDAMLMKSMADSEFSPHLVSTEGSHEEPKDRDDRRPPAGRTPAR